YLLLEIPLGTGTIPLLERYEDALAQPQVGVVITAEGQDQVDVTKFNNAVVFLRQFVRENHIPQKPLLFDLGKTVKLDAPHQVAKTGLEVAITILVDDKKESWSEVQEA